MTYTANCKIESLKEGTKNQVKSIENYTEESAETKENEDPE
jgi:hypothetical protein